MDSQVVGVSEYEGGAGNLGPLLAVVNLVYLSVVTVAGQRAVVGEDTVTSCAVSNMNCGADLVGLLLEDVPWNLFQLSPGAW